MCVNEKKDINDKLQHITFINVISMIAVLTLHTNGCFWQFSATESYWLIANVIECVFYFAVPIFFMITGITLIDFYDRYSLKQYFIKRINKTFVPFIAWSVIAILLNVLEGNTPISDISVRYLYQHIFSTDIVGIYWFFISLFIIYLSMPLFAAVDKSRRCEVFLYVAIVGFVLNSLSPFLKVILKSDLVTPFNIPAVSGVLIYPIVGWLLNNCILNKIHKIVIYMLSAIGLVVHIFGTYYLSMEAGSIVRDYKGYVNVPCILYSIGIFILLKDIGTIIMKNQLISSCVSFLAGYTFPIYLMQIYFLKSLPNLPFVDNKSIFYSLGAPYIIIVAIIIITWCIRKVPVIKKIVP